jgi:hypothetical protein
LFDLLEKNKADVEKTMGSVKGLLSYTLVRSEDGGFSVTVCNDKAGTDDSLEKARDWIAKNAAGISVAAPKVSEGSTVVDLNKDLESGACVSRPPGLGRRVLTRTLTPTIQHRHTSTAPRPRRLDESARAIRAPESNFRNFIFTIFRKLTILCWFSIDDGPRAAEGD